MAFASYVTDGIDDHLLLTWASTASDAERRTFTLSMWVKLSESEEMFSQVTGSDEEEWMFFAANPFFCIILDDAGNEEHAGGFDENEWAHVVFVVDTTQNDPDARFRIYVNNVPSNGDDDIPPAQNYITRMFVAGNSFAIQGDILFDYFAPGRIAFIDLVSGQALTPDYFAFDDNGTWTRKPYEGSYGNFGFSLDGSDGFNDVSGNGFHFTNVGGVQLDPNDLPPFIDVSGASIAPKMMHYRRLRI